MIEVIPLKPGIGADIEGISLASISDEEFEQVYRAWLDHQVIRFRNQPLSDGELQAFSRRFGPLGERPLGRMPEAERRKIENRYVTILSNIVVDGKPIGGLGSGEAAWHSDMTYVETPPPASVLLGIEVPDSGGDTYFASQYAAYEAIPDDLKDRVKGLGIRHNAAHTSVGKLRPGFEAFDSPLDAPGTVHPIVQTHAETGLRCLYLGRRDWAYVPGLELAESEALLDELWSYATLPDNVWRQQWRANDVVIWDNRCILHRRDAFDQADRRLMKRCQVLARTDAAQ